MQWVDTTLGKLPVKSWCQRVEKGALEQAVDLANHPHVFRHVALMPDCHVGYGMPIGGVVACRNAIIPNAVGVDIGCGMCAVRTSFPAEEVTPSQIQRILDEIRTHVPMGEGQCHRKPQHWERFGELPDWLDDHARELAHRNLGSLGGGNHFIELQAGEDGNLWLMLHSGSRNLGYRIAEHHHAAASKAHPELGDLAFLEVESEAGKAYISEMNLALAYARENRARMMEVFRAAVAEVLRKVDVLSEINIHHNYAVPETHFGESVWVHRKGATSARKGEEGIIPGSMGTCSYIVRGFGNPESFQSCAHGAGRKMGRMAASRTLSKEECDKAMKGVVYSGWHPFRGGGKKMKGLLDLSEAPQAYKDIDAVMEASSDLAEPLVRLRPLGVLKG
ncbi:MAG TPA: RtcB family protein [Pontiella sp.]|nr:RtcB family protein [Pontiella sp.]